MLFWVKVVPSRLSPMLGLFYSTALGSKFHFFYMASSVSNVPLKFHFKYSSLVVSGICLCLLYTETKTCSHACRTAPTVRREKWWEAELMILLIRSHSLTLWGFFKGQDTFLAIWDTPCPGLKLSCLLWTGVSSEHLWTISPCLGSDLRDTHPVLFIN